MSVEWGDRPSAYEHREAPANPERSRDLGVTHVRASSGEARGARRYDPFRRMGVGGDRGTTFARASRSLGSGSLCDEGFRWFGGGGYFAAGYVSRNRSQASRSSRMASCVARPPVAA